MVSAADGAMETVALEEAGDGISAEDGPFPIEGSELRFNLDWTTIHHTGVDIPVNGRTVRSWSSITASGLDLPWLFTSSPNV